MPRQGEANKHNLSLHRLTVYFFTHETLVRELHAFIDTSAGASRPDMDQLPNLFIFAFRTALLTVVGHYLEGRHRGIRLQIFSGAGNTKPGLQSTGKITKRT